MTAEIHELRPQWWRALRYCGDAYVRECALRAEDIRPFTFPARDGVFTVSTKRRTTFDDPIWIADPIIVLLRSHDNQGCNWSSHLQWLGYDGRTHSARCSCGVFHVNPGGVARELVRRKFRMDASVRARTALLSYLNASAAPIVEVAASTFTREVADDR